MNSTFSFTTHASVRMQQREIPPGIIDIIITYGRARDAGNGASKHGLAKKSLRDIRRIYGPGVADALKPFRRAYVVAAGGKVITAAFAQQPIFA